MNEQPLRLMLFLAVLTAASKVTGFKVNGRFDIEPLDNPNGLYAADINPKDEPMFGWKEDER